MSSERAYRCLNCREHTVTREFDTAHLSTTCPVCGSFQRFINDAVFAQFQAFEESPPDSLDWELLDRRDRLAISERVTRTSRSIEDYEIEA